MVVVSSDCFTSVPLGYVDVITQVIVDFSGSDVGVAEKSVLTTNSDTY